MVSLTVHIAAFAQAVGVILAHEDTPAILRKCMKYFIYELRESLPPDEKRRVDGIEAEAVITLFSLQPPKLSLPDEDSPQESHETLSEQFAILVGTAE